MPPELTSIFDVLDSVVFVCGLAIGAAGRHGLRFIATAIETLRGGQADASQQRPEE